MQQFIQWGGLTPEQLKAQQQSLIEEHYLLKRLNEARQLNATMVAAVGGNSQSSQITPGTQTVLATFTDLADDTIKWFVAAPREGQFSEVTSTGLPANVWSRWGVESLVSGQYCMIFDNTLEANTRTYIFIEADGTEQSRLTVTSENQSIDNNNQRVISITDFTNKIFYTWNGVTRYTDTQVLAGATGYQLGSDYHRLAQLSHIILKVVTVDEEEREVETFYHHSNGTATQIEQNTPAVSGFTLQVSAHELSKWLIIQARSVATSYTTAISFWDIVAGGNYLSTSLHLTSAETTEYFGRDWFGPNAEPLVWSQGTDNLKVIAMSPAQAGQVPELMPFYDFAHGGGLTYNQYVQQTTFRTNTPGSGNPNLASTGWIITNIGTDGGTNTPPITGNLTAINHMHMIYQFAGGPVRSFSLGEIYAENQPLMVNDTIIWPIVIGTELKFIKITAATPDLSEITGPEDLLPYAVQGLGLGAIGTELTRYEMLEVNGGVLVKYNTTADDSTSTTLAVISTNPADTVQQNYIVVLPEFDFNSTWTNQLTGSGPYVFYGEGTSAWIWNANLDVPSRWSEIAEFANADLSTWDQRSQWHPMGRGDVNYVVRVQDGEADDLWAIGPLGPVIVPSPEPGVDSLNVRVGENGFYAIWRDADRDNLFTISHYSMLGQLLSTTETLYDDYDSRNYRGDRAVIDLEVGPTDADCAAWIGGPNGADLKPLNANSVSYYSI